MTDNITLPRAVGERLRDFMHDCDEVEPLPYGERTTLAALDAALKEPERHVSLVCPQCNWTLQEQEPDAKREPATDEQAEAAYDGERGTLQWVDFRDGWLHAERWHGIRREDK